MPDCFGLVVIANLSSSSSAETPEQSPPSPSPEEPVAPANSPLLSPPLPSPSAETGSPSDSPVVSPPAPSPSDSPLVSPPAPPPSDLVPSGSAPASASTEGSELNHSNNVDAGSGDEGESKGMSGGKKAGIVVGVIVAACMVGLGGLVYKKRQNNIRRSDYGYAARREIL
ncbi:classical arabinogalactan protein [Salix suchowensis]|nr:classical arabinogalactan protein [Salix suchowensis]